MATIAPFKGIRYNRAITGDLKRVIAPPYDVIALKEQELYYGRSPYNIIRLEYGMVYPDDHERDNRYTRAAATLERWMAEEVFLVEQERALYLYEHSFSYRNNGYRRTGLMAALKVEPYANKAVLPHEDTLLKPKADRLELLRRCRANFSPIFGLFSDPDGEIEALFDAVRQGPPALEISGAEGQHHRLWIITGRPRQEALVRLLEPRPVIIADGHHRYETALAFSREADQGRHPGCGYLLANLVNLQDPSLVILPSHRLLAGLTGDQIEKLESLVELHFEVLDRGKPERLDPAEFIEEIGNRGRHTPVIGLLLPGKTQLLIRKNRTDPDDLDVSVLKRLLLDPIFNSSTGSVAENHVTYTLNEREARRAVLVGEAQAAFILNPPPVDEVVSRASRSEIMPDKSTYFYPKPPGGLVIHHLDLSHA